MIKQKYKNIKWSHEDICLDYCAQGFILNTKSTNTPPSVTAMPCRECLPLVDKTSTC